jgi:transcriptional regulator with XRE-family HTH domain/tetratricopeptide (TPR) repeat protein
MQRARTENWRLRWERQRRGWSQDDVVDHLQDAAASRGDPELGVDRNTVSRWERGISRPTPRYVQLLSEVFTLRPEDLGLILAPPPPGPPSPVSPTPTHHPDDPVSKLSPEVDRRTFLRHAAGIAGLAAIPAGLEVIPGGLPIPPNVVQGEPWERLIHALQRPSPVDSTLVTDVETLTAGLHVLEGRVPARNLIAQVSVHLDRLAELLQGSATETLRQRLICTAGDSAVLGAWIAWDMGDRAGAFRLFETAITAAREGADPALRACILAYGSYGASADGDTRRARDLLEVASRCVDGAGFPATVGWIACRQAEETALLGDATDALRLLDRGLGSFTDAAPEDERVWTRFLDATRVRGFAISTYARVGDAESALRITEEVLASLDPEHVKQRAIVLAGSAEVHLQQGNLDEGIELAVSALAAALETETTWGLEGLKRLRPLLRRWEGNPDARQLDQRLAAARP